MLPFPGFVIKAIYISSKVYKPRCKGKGGGSVYEYEDFSTPLFKSIGLKRTFTSNSLEVQPANSLQVACSSLKTHMPINGIMFSFACPTHFTCITHLANEIMDKANNAL